MHTVDWWWWDVQVLRPNSFEQANSVQILGDTSTWCNTYSDHRDVRSDASHKLLRRQESVASISYSWKSSLHLAQQPCINGSSACRIIAYSPTTIKVLQGRSTPETNQYRYSTRCIRMDMIDCESHFNFVKIHLLSHLSDHIGQFGNIPMYWTETAELAQKTHLKDGWRQSNKNDASCQIMHSNSRQHAVRMKLSNLVSICHCGGDFSLDVLQHLDMTSSPHPELITHKRFLTGH